MHIQPLAHALNNCAGRVAETGQAVGEEGSEMIVRTYDDCGFHTVTLNPFDLVTDHEHWRLWLRQRFIPTTKGDSR